MFGKSSPRPSTTLCSVLAALLLPAAGMACTNLLVTRGASATGSTYLAYSSDAHDFYGDLVYRPGGLHPSGATREIVEWDTGRHLGEIPEAPRTFTRIGFINEHQVAVGETTFGGRKELEGSTGMLDYGSLMEIALERAKTAREAIDVIGDLVTKYGYRSEGESISITDPEEAWILEIVPKGGGEKGAVWVAERVPDGEIAAHANQSRIRTFPLHDPDRAIYSPDVISFARKKGWYTGPDEKFSFADTYAPLTFGAIRFCEARVWSMFRRAAPSLGLGVEYADGHHPDKRLPFSVRPDAPLTTADVMALMRDHFEGTPLDMTKDVGAGPFACPYRWRPLVWKVDGTRYLNERAISTQQTGLSFVAQSRAALPDPIGGVLWFGVDDTAMTSYVPIYCGVTKVPPAYAEGVASMTRFSWDSAFWVFNWVSNFAYSRYKDMIVDIERARGELEGRFLAEQPEVDRAALALYEQAPLLARDYLTRYSVSRGQLTVERWRKLGQELLVKYLDGNVKDRRGRVSHPPYPESWYRRIVADHGDVIRMPEKAGH